MSKVGNTSSIVFLVLGQFCWHTANGYEVAWSPYPNMPETGELHPDNRVTFRVVEGKNPDVDPVVKDTLNAVNAVFSALTTDEVVSVERLRGEEGEEKITITIKRGQNNDGHY